MERVEHTEGFWKKAGIYTHSIGNTGRKRFLRWLSCRCENNSVLILKQMCF